MLAVNRADDTAAHPPWPISAGHGVLGHPSKLRPGTSLPLSLASDDDLQQRASKSQRLSEAGSKKETTCCQWASWLQR